MTRVALIGLGEAGATIHLPALRALPGVAVVGAADPDDARRGAAARAGIAVHRDVAGLLAESRPQLVVVASPPAMHAEHCRLAFDAGADVLCEKPFAASVAEARAVADLARACGRRVFVNHEFRAMPIYRDLIGRVRSDGGPVVAQLWQAIHHDPASESGWRGRLRRRALYEAGVHLVDVALQLFGETPHAVRGSFSSGSATAGPDAVVLATLEFSRGRLCQLTQVRLHRGDRQYLEVRADTERASYRASFGGRARVSAGMLRSTRPHVALERGGSGMAWVERGASRTVFSRNGGTPLVTSTRDVIRACLQAQDPHPFSAAAGVEALRVIAAAYLSDETGRTVEPLGRDREAVDALPLAALTPE